MCGLVVVLKLVALQGLVSTHLGGPVRIVFWNLGVRDRRFTVVGAGMP